MTTTEKPADASCVALTAGLGGWMPFPERIPEEGQEVVALYWLWGDPSKGHGADVCFYYRGDFINDEGDPLHTPTHWVPVPPNAGNEGR